MKKIVPPKKLPESFRPLLWSYDFEKIDPEKHKKTIIVNAINYGDLDHWRWLYNTYHDNISEILANLQFTEFRPEVRELAGLIFKVKSLENAPRSFR